MNEQQVDGGTPQDGDRMLATVIYVLYAVGFITGITALIGVILAYVQRREAPAWLQSHYTYQIYTFWIGLAAILVGSLLSAILVGFLVLLAWFIWTVARIVIGLSQLHRRRPIPNPTALLTGL